MTFSFSSWTRRGSNGSACVWTMHRHQRTKGYRRRGKVSIEPVSGYATAGIGMRANVPYTGKRRTAADSVDCSHDDANDKTIKKGRRFIVRPSKKQQKKKEATTVESGYPGITVWLHALPPGSKCQMQSLGLLA